MARYRIEVLPSAEQDIADLPEPARGRIVDAIDTLADNPRPPGVKKMEGYKNLFRIRVGQHRVAYAIHDKVLLVLIAAAGNRDKIYKLLKRRMG